MQNRTFVSIIDTSLTIKWDTFGLFRLIALVRDAPLQITALQWALIGMGAFALSTGNRILEWFMSPDWVRSSIAQRNMPVVAVGAITVGLFSFMLAFCLIANAPCPFIGFDEAAHESPDVLFRFTVTSTVITIMMVVIFVIALFYIRKKWNRPALASALTMVFVFMAAMIWGIADSSYSVDRQILIFATIEFLVAGLFVFNPIVSLLFFSATFLAFCTALDLSGQFTDIAAHDLVYLAVIDIVVCWVVYGMFVRGCRHERAIMNLSQRDELTGARNRHALREAFTSYLNKDLCVLLCDIDNFKYYNDNYDHGVGDNLLKEFYFALRDAFDEECVYRYGGDEFLIVLVDQDQEDLNRAVQKLRKSLANIPIEGEVAGLAFSGGYACGIAADNIAFRDMLHVADERLIEAKRTGKNRIVGAYI